MARRKKRPSSAFQAARLVAALAVAAAALIIVLWFLGREQAPEPPLPEFSDRVLELAARRGVSRSAIAADNPIRKIDGVFVRTWTVTVGDREDLAGLLADLRAEAARYQGVAIDEARGGGEAARLRVDLDHEAFEIVVLLQPPVVIVTATPVPEATATPRPQPPPGARGKLAIILDDGGQAMDLVPAAAALPAEVAVSVMPFLPYSGETAAEIHRSGHEVWLHLPMEPLDYPESKPGPGAVLVSMSEDELRATVHAALNNVPHVVGVNNHMGSRATADLRTMTWVMQELKARGIAFVDSRTTRDTVAEDAARSQGVPTGRRHVFLDNDRHRASIRRQLAEAVYRSRMEGEIIAIGHLAKATIEVLEVELPTLSSRKVDLVPPTALLR